MKTFKVLTGLRSEEDRQMFLSITAPGLKIGENRDRVILTDKHGVEIFGVVHVAHGVKSVTEVAR